MTGGQVLACRALIAASGIDDVLPDIPGLAERWGRSVPHCPYCHGWEVRDRRLGVLATSPLGLHQLQLVRQWSDQVVFVNAAAGPLDLDTERRLAARGIKVVACPVLEVVGDGEALRVVRTADGRSVSMDALFTVAAPRRRDGFLAGLGLDRTETPFGSFLAVDATGRTSHPHIWAAGNVTDPTANVPMSMRAGSVAAAMVNMTLVTEDFVRAVAGRVKGAA
jgi:thioredoxin reductase